MDSLPAFTKNYLTDLLRVANEGFKNGRVDASTKARTAHWNRWRSHCQTLGVDPYLQGENFLSKCRTIQSFAAGVRTGRLGGGRQVRAGTVSQALSAVNTTIALAIDEQPFKVKGSKNFIPLIAQTLNGWEKEDPGVEKKMPVEADVPELLVDMGMEDEASELTKAVGDLCLMAFYFLLRIGEYTVKGSRKKNKQTVQFRMCDVTFFERTEKNGLRQLPRSASNEQILAAAAVTLRLQNQKNGWKNVCMSQHDNGLGDKSPTVAIAKRYIHIRQHTKSDKELLSAYFVKGKRKDVKDSDIRAALKLAATALDYEGTRGIPTGKIDTHSLRVGGANALSLNGYSVEHIQKMGRWRSNTFLEYIRESLSDFSEGMSKAMSKTFGFVSLEAGVAQDVTSVIVDTDYNVAVSAGAA